MQNGLPKMLHFLKVIQLENIIQFRFLGFPAALLFFRVATLLVFLMFLMMSVLLRSFVLLLLPILDLVFIFLVFVFMFVFMLVFLPLLLFYLFIINPGAKRTHTK